MKHKIRTYVNWCRDWSIFSIKLIKNAKFKIIFRISSDNTIICCDSNQSIIIIIYHMNANSEVQTESRINHLRCWFVSMFNSWKICHRQHIFRYFCFIRNCIHHILLIHKPCSDNLEWMAFQSNWISIENQKPFAIWNICISWILSRFLIFLMKLNNVRWNYYLSID